jgi:hypothetical protein
MTPSGIETATCLFVAQCLNHYATAHPYQSKSVWYIDGLTNKLICTVYKNSFRTSQRTLRWNELVNAV